MHDALENFTGGIKCAGLIINNLKFADDIDLMTNSSEELVDITRKLDETSQKYGMEISAEKSKVMISGKSVNQNVVVHINGDQLKQVREFKYLGSTLTEKGTSEIEVKLEWPQAH